MTQEQKDKAWNVFRTMVVPVFCDAIRAYDRGDYLEIKYTLGHTRFSVKVDEFSVLDKQITGYVD